MSKALQQLRDATAGVRDATDPVVRVTTSITFASLWLVPAGQGLALGRLPLAKTMIDQAKLVALARDEVKTFVAWLRKEAAATPSP